MLEVQLATRGSKRWSWPLYLAGARAKHGCDACLVVVTPYANVARWARRPIVLGPGAVVTPLVLGPTAFPTRVSHRAARARPELALLALIAHGRSAGGLALAHVAARAAVRLPEARQVLYLDLIASSLDDAARTAFEEGMSNGTYKYQSDFIKKYIAAREKAEAEGRAAGLAKGLAEGRTEGLAKGEAKAVLLILEARRIAVGARQRKKIETCSDRRQLERWLKRAATATTAAEVFGD